MFKDVVGDWPTYDRFILTSCDAKYFDHYFPRFYKTFKQHWELPIHVHVIDPTQDSLTRLDRLPVSYTYCTTDKSVLKFPYSYETYYQSQRFILLGHNLLEGQSVIVADVDSYAQRRPSAEQKKFAQSDMAFTEYRDIWSTKGPRLMATFCNFHYSRRSQAKSSAIMMQDLIENTDRLGVDQFVITKFFRKLPFHNLRQGKWIRHLDVKNEYHEREHKKCLIYHTKGNRGKGKGIHVGWPDI
jgi:hypothetical protein